MYTEKNGNRKYNFNFPFFPAFFIFLMKSKFSDALLLTEERGLRYMNRAPFIGIIRAPSPLPHPSSTSKVGGGKICVAGINHDYNTVPL